MPGNHVLARGSRTMTSLRSPSMSGRAMSAGIGVTRCTQYDDNRGVRKGTGTSQRRRCRSDAYPVIISP